MTKGDAAIELIYDATKRQAHSNASAKRVRRACDVLGLDHEGRLRVFCSLDYCNRSGTPYNSQLKPAWDHP